MTDAGKRAVLHCKRKKRHYRDLVPLCKSHRQKGRDPPAVTEVHIIASKLSQRAGSEDEGVNYPMILLSNIQGNIIVLGPTHQ